MMSWLPRYSLNIYFYPLSSLHHLEFPLWWFLCSDRDFRSCKILIFSLRTKPPQLQYFIANLCATASVQCLECFNTLTPIAKLPKNCEISRVNVFCQDVIVMNMLMLMHSIVQYDMFQRTLDILLLIIKIYYSSFNLSIKWLRVI